LQIKEMAVCFAEEGRNEEREDQGEEWHTGVRALALGENLI
jgi:hypothetical protein